MTIDEYLSLAMLSSITIAIICGTIVYIPSKFLILALFSAFTAGFLCYCIFIWYPSFVASNRGKEIDIILPHAAAFMCGLSRGGVNIIDVFKSLSGREDVYGEVAREAGVVIKDTEYLGLDVSTALRNVAKTTPSEKFCDFIENLLSVVESGGDTAEHFHVKSKQYQNEGIQEQDKFIKKLEIFAESYTTVFIAGLLFLFIILIVMEMMSPGYMNWLRMITYAIIPLTSAIFIVLIDTMANPVSMQKMRVKTTDSVKRFGEISIKDAEDEDREMKLYKGLKRYEMVKNIKKVLKAPIESFKEEPKRVLYVSVPIALAYLILQAYRLPSSIDALDDHVLFTILISLVPFTFFYEL
jgi:flagellar protein FlaJ